MDQGDEELDGQEGGNQHQTTQSGYRSLVSVVEIFAPQDQGSEPSNAQKKRQRDQHKSHAHQGTTQCRPIAHMVVLGP